jgi:Ca2+-binding EF-hand superfamily protein
MYDKSIFEEELENKLRLYDQENNGYIEQSDLKNVLGQLGVILTIS